MVPLGYLYRWYRTAVGCKLLVNSVDFESSSLSGLLKVGISNI